MLRDEGDGVEDGVDAGAGPGGGGGVADVADDGLDARVGVREYGGNAVAMYSRAV